MKASANSGSLEDDKMGAQIPMMKVLICDDDESFTCQLRENLRSILNQMEKPAQIRAFNSVEEIPDEYLACVDIAFLDIDFANKGYTGIDIAKRIRKFSEDTIIIFVTNFAEYAPEGYEVMAFRYLLKGELDTKLQPYLLQALSQLHRKRQVLRMNHSGEIVSIPLEDISYIEAQLRMVAVHLLEPNEENIHNYTFYATISNLEETLEAQGFLRVHKSYLVNMQHIRKYQCMEVELTNGVTLRASKQAYAEQKKKYILWKGLG